MLLSSFLRPTMVNKYRAITKFVQSRGAPLWSPWALRSPRGLGVSLRSRLGFPFLILFLLLLTACGDSFAPTQSIGPIDSPTVRSQPNTTPSIRAVGHFR